MPLTVGSPAPNFTSTNQDGTTVSLSDFLGKKILLYFYPKDDTSVCTTQACSLRDGRDLLEQEGYTIIGVSPDDEKSHQKFIAKHNLNFTLLTDTDKNINQLYDVWHEKSLYGNKYMGTVRTTFLIDEQGIITHIIDKVKSKEHADQVLKLSKGK
jgi:thioredoxin-dependent peroxiredoxin